MSRRNGIILGLLFLILMVEIVVLAPKEIGSPEEAVSPQKTSSDKKAQGRSGQLMKDVYSVEAKKEGKEWELWAAQAEQPKETEDWMIENVRVKFYGSGGVVYTVTGRKGQVSPNRKGIRDIRIRGNVVTRSSNGYVFKSESVFYDSEKKRLTSPTDIEMRAPPDKDGEGMALTGTDMVADMETNEIVVSQNVKATKPLKGVKTLRITSHRATFSGRTKMAHFTGDVVVTYETMTLSGPEARFAYDSGGQALESVLVSGGIKVTDTDKFAVSRSVDVNFINDQIVFKGSPRVTQSGDQLTGDEIVFMDGGRRVQVKNARARLESLTEGTGSQKTETRK